MKIFALTLSFLLSFSASASDKLNLSYRGAVVGDSESKVRAAAAQIHEEVTEDRFDSESLSLSGHKKGDRGFVCPVAAPLEKRPDCHRASYSFLKQEGQFRLTSISVSQSFHLTVPFDTFMARITAAYGTPAVDRTAPYSIYGQRVSSDRSMLWGGAKVPTGPYVQSIAPFEDIRDIGGRFVSLRVLSDEVGVIGYTLRITDAQLMNTLEAARKAKEVEAFERKRKDALGNLKF